jgi:RNA polymerase primary sigma factor
MVSASSVVAGAAGPAGATAVRPAPVVGAPDLVRLYLQGLGSRPLLSHKDEIRLAKRIEAGRAARQALDAGEDDASRRRMLQRRVESGHRARSEFAAANLRLVVSIAKRWQHRGLELLDLIQEGNVGLLRAVDHFDWRQGAKFSTYATWWITNAIVQAVGEEASPVHLPRRRWSQARVLSHEAERIEHETGTRPGALELSVATGIALEDITAVRRAANRVVSLQAPIDDDGNELGDVIADPAVDVGETAVGYLLPAEVAQMVDSLPPAAARVLRLRYGIGTGRARSTAEVAATLAISAERVSQIERRALLRLRHQLRPARSSA